MYIQINVELDLKDGETLYKLKKNNNNNNKTTFHPLLVHEV